MATPVEAPSASNVAENTLLPTTEGKRMLDHPNTVYDNSKASLNEVAVTN